MATRSTPRMPACRRCAAPSPAQYGELHNVELDPGAEIVVTASGVQALNVGDPRGARSRRRSAGAHSRLAQWLVQCGHGQRRGARKSRILCAASATASTSTRWRRPSRRAPACCCTLRHPIRWDGSLRTRISSACWISPAATNSGCWPTKSTTGSITRAASLGEPVPSILRKATRDDAVMVVQSFSKTYCMTGWRVGWLVARRDLAHKATQLNEFIVSHAPSFAQKAAETALAHGEAELAGMLERLKQNRDLCLDALGAMPGVTVPTPDGAFYLFPKIDGLTDSFGFCRNAAGRMQGRPGARRGLRRGRRRLRAHLLRGRTRDPGARHGAPGQILEFANRLNPNRAAPSYTP